MGMQGDNQRKMSESEVLTVPFISHRYFSGNYQATFSFKFSKSIPLQVVKKPFSKKASSLVWSFAFPFPSHLRNQWGSLPKFPLLH
jgi:hypothetical protein